MIGWDFYIFWQIGRAILAGHSPYTVEMALYPPATTFFFVLFGLLPYTFSFAFWSGVNVVLYFHRLIHLGKGAGRWLWLLFTPFLFNLLTGEVDIYFWWALAGLRPPKRPGESKPIETWLPALAGAFFTLKPQFAAVILPWYLIRWLRYERGLFVRWLGVTVLLHALPLLYAPTIYGQWLAGLQGVAESRLGFSGGIFTFNLVGVPFWLLAAIGLGLAVWGWFQDEITSRAAQLIAFPITIWYDDVLLTGIGPVWLMVPVSWLAFGAAYLAQNSLPLVTIPAAALGWLVWKQMRARRLRQAAAI